MGSPDAPELVIRRFVDSDSTVVLDMDRRGREVVVELKGGTAWLAEHPPIDGLLSDPQCVVYVADLAGHAIGFLVAQDRIDPVRGRVCDVERVFVDERAREIGCGDALLARALDEARERACSFIEGEALPGDRATKNLYERAGITARRIVVSKGL